MAVAATALASMLNTDDVVEFCGHAPSQPLCLQQDPNRMGMMDVIISWEDS